VGEGAGGTRDGCEKGLGLLQLPQGQQLLGFMFFCWSCGGCAGGPIGCAGGPLDALGDLLYMLACHRLDRMTCALRCFVKVLCLLAA
jgi:hypothetical protein